MPRVIIAAPVGNRQTPQREVRKIAPELESVTGGTIRVIVQTKGRPTAAQEDAVKGKGGRKHRHYEAIDAFVADVPANSISELAAREDISYVSPDRTVRSQMNVVGETVGATQLQAGIERANGLTGKGIGIAIIDSGVSTSHPDFQKNGRSRILASVDFTGTGAAVQGQGNTWSGTKGNGNTWSGTNADGIILTDGDDPAGHGTGVAGVAAGNGAASTGYEGNYRGIAPEANIIDLRALDANGAGKTSSAMDAIDWAIVNQKRFNIRVINMSLGAPVRESFRTDPLCQAVARAVRAGIIVVCSAGNHGRTEEIVSYDANGEPIYRLVYGGINSPGNSPYAITVGASDSRGTAKRSDDQMASFSSKGPTGFDHLAKPDIIAPGRGVIAPMSRVSNPTSAVLRPDRVVEAVSSAALPNAYYKYYGTSFSAPIVSGTIALMLEANKSLTPILTKAALLRTAQTLPGAAFASKEVSVVTQGTGLLNALAAVEMARAIVPNADKLKANDQIFRSNMTLGKLSSSYQIGGETVAQSTRVLYSDGVLFLDRPVLTNGIMLADGALLGSGIILTDGMALGSGIILTDGQMQGNGNTWSGNTWSGSTWSGSTWSVTNSNGNTWSVTNGDGNTWSVTHGSGNTWSGTTGNGNTWSGTSAQGNTWSGTNADGIILLDGIILVDGIILTDGIILVDGIILTDSTLAGDGNTWSGVSQDGNTWSGVINADGNTWS